MKDSALVRIENVEGLTVQILAHTHYRKIIGTVTVNKTGRTYASAYLGSVSVSDVLEEWTLDRSSFDSYNLETDRFIKGDGMRFPRQAHAMLYVHCLAENLGIDVGGHTNTKAQKEYRRLLTNRFTVGIGETIEIMDYLLIEHAPKRQKIVFPNLNTGSKKVNRFISTLTYVIGLCDILGIDCGAQLNDQGLSAYELFKSSGWEPSNRDVIKAMVYLHYHKSLPVTASHTQPKTMVAVA